MRFQVTRIQTTDKGASLRDLYPGAAYHIQVHHQHCSFDCYILIIICIMNIINMISTIIMMGRCLR